MSLTKSEISELIDDNITSGGRRTNAVKTREVLDALNEAVFGNINSFTTYNANALQRTYAVADTTIYNGIIYQANAATSGAFDVSKWNKIIAVSDAVYNATDWNGNTDVPTKNTLRNKFSLIDSAIAGITPISDLAYNATDWNGNTEGATKNALRDKFVSVDDNLAGLWSKSGNDLPARGAFGSTITGTGKGWDWKVNGVTVGAVEDTAKWVWGQASSFADTYFSIYSQGSNSSTYATQWKNSAGTLGWFRDDGLLTAYGGLSTDGIRTILIDGDGDLNTWIGPDAGALSSGTQNLFMSRLAGYESIVTASIGIGPQALRGAGNVSTTVSITAVGGNAGYNYNGYNSVLLGNAGFNASGDYNFYGGDRPGESATGGSKIGLGRRALKASSNGMQFGIGDFAGEGLSDANTGIFGSYYNIYFNHQKENSDFGANLNSVTLQTAMSMDGENKSAAASEFIHAAARATGNAEAGKLKWMYAIPEASGTTRQSLGLALEMNGSTGDFKFYKKINVTLTNYAGNAAAITGGLSVGDLYRTAGAVMVVI